MDGRGLLEHFATIADAPGGAQRLRDFVLDLAVAGRLVEQDPGDEAASALVERIQAEMKEAWNAGRGKPNRPNTPREPTGTLPDRWCWAYVPQLGFVNPKNEVMGDPVAAFVPMPLIPVDTREPVGFEERRWSEISKGYTHVADGDVAVAKITPCFQNGKSAVFRDLPSGIGAATTELFVVRPTPGGVSPRYLHIVFRSPTFIRDGVPEMTGTAGQQRLPRQYLTDTPIPVPPPAEQERIVAKVDELLELCDELEARQNRVRRVGSQFRRSALHALATANSAAETGRAWKQVSAGWELVTGEPAGLQSIREVVLKLAVDGRLVPRVLDEGSADRTLRDLDVERARLARAGEISRVPARVRVEPGDEPFSIPLHWMWVRVDDVVTHVVDCLHRTPSYTSSGYPAIRTCDVEPGLVLIDQALLVDEETFAEQTRRLTPRAGDVLYSREGGRYGIAAVVPEGPDLCLSQRMMQFRCGKGIVPEYFSWYLNSPLGFGQAAADVGGSASPHVNIRSIRRFLMPLPPTGEQRRIVDAVTTAFSLLEELAGALRRRERIGERLGAAVMGVYAFEWGERSRSRGGWGPLGQVTPPAWSSTRSR